MLDIIKSLILQALDILQENSGWMGWNLFLAFLPLGMSMLLFRDFAPQPSISTANTSPPWRSPTSLAGFVSLALLGFFLSLSITSTHLIRLVAIVRGHRLVWFVLILAAPLVEIVALLNLRQTSLRGRMRSPFWWVGVLAFVAFLPNAPYVLTDIIHLVQDIRVQNSIWLITLVTIPLYLVFILAGFQAYVLSIINLGYYLKRLGLGQFILPAEITLHGLSAIGIYLGRFLRFNSWDIVTRFDTLATSIVEDVLNRDPLLIMTVTFILISGLYWFMKRVTLAVATYHESSNTPSCSV